jgi:hypothetical protein
MTETYAATVAAVAPVIWLVAVLEWHRFVKGSVSVASALDALTRSRQRAESVEGDASNDDLRAVAALVHQAREAVANRPFDAPHQKKMSIVYLIVASLLLTAEGIALFALGSESTDGSSGDAYFCFYALLVGFLAITVLPSYAASKEANAALRKVAGDTAWLSAWLHRHAPEDGVEGERE